MRKYTPNIEELLFLLYFLYLLYRNYILHSARWFICYSLPVICKEIFNGGAEILNVFRAGISFTMELHDHWAFI